MLVDKKKKKKGKILVRRRGEVNPRKVPILERGEIGIEVRGEWTVEELENAVKHLNASESRDLKHFLNYVDEYLTRLAEDLVLVKRAEKDIADLLPLEGPKKVNDIIVGLYDHYIKASDTRIAVLALGRAFDKLAERFEEKLKVELKFDEPLKLDASVPLEIAPYDEAMQAMAVAMDTMTTGFLRLIKVVGDLSEKFATWTEIQSRTV